MDDHVPKPQNNFAFGRTSHKQRRHKTPCSLAGCGAQGLAAVALRLCSRPVAAR